MNDQLQTAKQARRQVEQVRKRLLKPAPETLASCAGPLLEAIGCLDRLQSNLQAGAPGSTAHLIRNEMTVLRGELSTASALLRAAGLFYEGYGNLLGTGPEPAEMNYCSQGTTPTREHNENIQPRLEFHG